MKNIVILEEKDNPLLHRKELVVEIDHTQEPTPSREEVRKRIAAMKGISEELVIVHSIKPMFGVGKSRAFVKIYESLEKLKEIEPEHILRKHGLAQ
ncbi:MAG: 30S ribosomal protein S24e [bacterium]|nr:30S ribosomal protein S24e [bacterium]